MAQVENLIREKITRENLASEEQVDSLVKQVNNLLAEGTKEVVGKVFNYYKEKFFNNNFDVEKNIECKKIEIEAKRKLLFLGENDSELANVADMFIKSDNAYDASWLFDNEKKEIAKSILQYIKDQHGGNDFYYLNIQEEYRDLHHDVNAIKSSRFDVCTFVSDNERANILNERENIVNELSSLNNKSREMNSEANEAMKNNEIYRKNHAAISAERKKY